MNTEKTAVDWYAHGARYYDPQLSRWHSPDPLSELYTSFSPYHYVANNPVNFVDPNGMSYDKPSPLEREQQKGGWTDYSWEMAWKMNGMRGSQIWGTARGPSAAAHAVWEGSVKDNPLYGDSADDFIYWWMMGHNDPLDWDAAIDYANKFYTLSLSKDFLHISAAGKIEGRTDDLFELAHQEAQKSDSYLYGLIADGGDKSFDTRKNNGGTWGLQFVATFGGGFNLEFGRVWDNKGGKKWYFTSGPSIGVDISLGFLQKNIYNCPNFSVDNYRSYGSSFDAGILIFDGIIAGGDHYEEKYKSFPGATYGENGWGMSLGLPFSAAWNSGKTRVW